jgi:hypothetical protein
MDILGAVVLLLLAFLSVNLLWSFKKDEWAKQEAERCLVNRCQIDDSWHSQGRVYTKGIALVEKSNGELAFIEQAKLCDVGLLK